MFFVFWNNWKSDFSHWGGGLEVAVRKVLENDRFERFKNKRKNPQSLGGCGFLWQVAPKKISSEFNKHHGVVFNIVGIWCPGECSALTKLVKPCVF